MISYREAVYMVFDELKILSDDSTWEPDHIIFLLDKYRALIIKQRYSHIRKNVPEAYYQPLDIIFNIEGTTSISPLPQVLDLNGIEIDTFSLPNINLVSPDRFPYTGIEKWLSSQVYATIDRDNYFKIKNTTLTNLTLYGIFEKPHEVYTFNNENIDLLDAIFPIEEAELQSIIGEVIKEMGAINYLPEDTKNNATDDFGSIPTPGSSNT